MGFDKLVAPLAGRPVVWHSVSRFASCDAVDEIILVVRPERREEFTGIVTGLPKVSSIIEGGAERYLSVWAGLRALDPGVRLVAVHDGARPLIKPATISRAIAGARAYGAVSVASPVVDTLKRVDSSLEVREGVDRTHLWSMQTPQVFQVDLLRAAYERLIREGTGVTDEVSAVQAAGSPVRLIANDDWNFKITYRRDLDLAELLVKLNY
jgi:2-C-methyl-D-erythritol 4-phosphate cytidylyltransferase